MLGKTQIKYIQSLYHKKFRDEFGIFVVEGPKILDEFAKNAPGLLNAIYATEKWIDQHKNLLRKAEQEKLIAITDIELQRISALTTPNEVLAIVQKKEVENRPKLNGKITLLLDGIQDPGNMGTIIRSADWFGVENIICSEDCADVYNSKVIQSSMGSIIRVNVLYEDLNEVFESAGEIPILAATLGGENIYSLGRLNECLLIIGNESRGVRPELLNHVSRMITIPKRGGAESLNAAVAVSIILSHLTAMST